MLAVVYSNHDEHVCVCLLMSVTVK
jgi:hypothetical protein